jgi:hypothetical protein
MRVHVKNGHRTIELTKLEEMTLANASCLVRELARYPEDYPRATLAAETLANLKEPFPTEAKK